MIDLEAIRKLTGIASNKSPDQLILSLVDIIGELIPITSVHALKEVTEELERVTAEADHALRRKTGGGA